MLLLKPRPPGQGGGASHQPGEINLNNRVQGFLSDSLTLWWKSGTKCFDRLIFQ